MFKNPTRLLTGAWVLSHESPLFYQGEAADGVRALAGTTAKVQTTEVAKVLDAFIELGMVSEVAAEPGVSRRYYERQECAGWDVIAACVDAAPKLS